MKTILVTGGCGFIGSNFIRNLLEHRDYHIVNVDKLTYAGNAENLADLENDPRYFFAKADIADVKNMEAIFQSHKPFGVINFAAETHVDRSIKNSCPFIQTNILGTHVLLELSRKFEVEKYHQVSTDEVYGDLGDRSTNFFTETTPLAPNCPYAAAKTSADLLVQSWYETYGLHTIITRCSNNYGPYQFPEKLIPLFLFKAMNNEPLPLYGDGQNVRDWLYVLDHCEAILTAFERSAAGEVWNIGGYNEKTNQCIAELIVKETGSHSIIEFVEDRKAHDRRYAIDAKKIAEKLGWEPQHTFESALPKTIQWYLHHRDWVEHARGKV